MNILGWCWAYCYGQRHCTHLAIIVPNGTESPLTHFTEASLVAIYTCTYFKQQNMPSRYISMQLQHGKWSKFVHVSGIGVWEQTAHFNPLLRYNYCCMMTGLIFRTTSFTTSNTLLQFSRQIHLAWHMQRQFQSGSKVPYSFVHWYCNAVFIIYEYIWTLYQKPLWHQIYCTTILPDWK